jgi:hypothetical protein
VSSKSKFSSILDAARGGDQGGKGSSSTKKRGAKRDTATAQAEGKRGPGRPSGKRSDPDFVQTTAYVRGDTYRDVRIALLQEGEGREYSELVEELLSEWLKKRK